MSKSTRPATARCRRSVDRRPGWRPPAERLAVLLAQLTGPDVAPIDDRAFRLALDALAPASVAARGADLACYARFVEEQGRGLLPASPADVAAYIEALEPRLKPASIRRRLSSLAAAHAMLALADPTRAAMVGHALKGLRRRRSTVQRQALGLRLGQAIDRDAAPGLTLSALLEACGNDPQGLRDAALLSLGYDAGLRVSELTAVELAQLTPDADGSAVLTIARSKTDQAGQGEDVWMSPDSLRRVRAWLDAAAIKDGVLFRRVGVDRRAAVNARRALAITDLAPNAKVDQARMAAVRSAPARERYTIGSKPLTRQGVTLIYRRVARRAADLGLVALFGAELDAAVAALSTHSLRVGLTQDLFAAGEDAGPIAQALRWRSTGTALRYGRRLTPKANAAARVLRDVRR